MSSSPSHLEQDIREKLANGAFEAAAVLTLRGYADELLGYLIGLLRSEEHAREVFSVFAEDLWQALPGLTLRTTMRAYCYALARNAAHRYLQRDLRKRRRLVPLSAADALSQAIAQHRTSTAAHLLSENQRRITRLRERLSKEEQELLTLRVDRGLDWSEVVEALGDDGDEARALARYRKRFQLIKQKLSRWAREEGIGPVDRE